MMMITVVHLINTGKVTVLHQTKKNNIFIIIPQLLLLNNLYDILATWIHFQHFYNIDNYHSVAYYSVC